MVNQPTLLSIFYDLIPIAIQLFYFTIKIINYFLTKTLHFKMSSCVYNLIIYFKCFKHPRIIILEFNKIIKLVILRLNYIEVIR